MYKQLRKAVAAATLRLEFYITGYISNFEEEEVLTGISEKSMV